MKLSDLSNHNKELIKSGKAEILKTVKSHNDVSMGHLVFVDSVIDALKDAVKAGGTVSAAHKALNLIHDRLGINHIPDANEWRDKQTRASVLMNVRIDESSQKSTRFAEEAQQSKVDGDYETMSDKIHEMLKENAYRDGLRVGLQIINQIREEK